MPSPLRKVLRLMSEPWTDDPRLYLADHTGKRYGLNWTFLTQRYMEQCSPEELTAQVRKMRIPQPGEVAKPVQPNQTPEKTIQLIVDYYQAHNKIPWIAKELKMAEATVRKWLIERGVYDVSRDRTRKS